MWSILSGMLVVAAGAVAIPAVVLLAEVIAAIVAGRSVPGGRSVPASGDRPRLAVLVPAHDESMGMLPTLADIRGQLAPGDRLLVVADNCSDDTAAVAAAAGSEVVVRADPSRIGKGYALDFGIAHLAADAPGVVVIVDADCRLGEGALERLAETCVASRRPVQALYLMHAAQGAGVGTQVAELAWLVKNWIRPLGLAAMGLPCQLTGSGMAFPWKVIRSASLASGEIVEDLVLGLELARRGYAPLFCPAARVISEFPATAEAAARQRQRWEHGHLRTIVSHVPRLLRAGIARRDPGMLALALDLAVPPIALLVLALLATMVVGALVVTLGMSFATFIIGACGLAALALALVLAWSRFGRGVLPQGALLAIVRYLVGKLPLYGRLLRSGFLSEWVRTDRSR